MWIDNDRLNATNVPNWGELAESFRRMREYCTESGTKLIPEHSSAYASFQHWNSISLDHLTWSSVYPRLRAHKSARDQLLLKLQQSDAVISFLQMSCNILILRRGIHDLPNEVLAKIFEEGYSPDWEGSKFVDTVFHVCGRFRQIALRMPHLWSTLRSYQTVEGLSHFVHRSKQCSLTINVKNRDVILQSFLPFIIAHVERWVRFRCEYPLSAADNECILSILGRQLYLPNLTSLSNLSSSPFQSNWIMPRLLHYLGQAQPNFLPVTSLVSCALHLREQMHSSNPDYGLEDVLAFLDDNKCPKHLTLTLKTIIPGYSWGGRSNGKHAYLPHLTQLSIHWDGGCYINDDFGRFIRNLHLPDLRELSLEFSAIDPDGLFDFIADPTEDIAEVMFPVTNHFPALHTLKFVADPYFLFSPSSVTSTANDPEDLLEVVLKRNPTLKDLYVEASGLCCPSYRWNDFELPRLRTIHFKYCDRIRRQLVDWILDRSNELETLKVEGCRGLSESYLRGLKDRMEDRLDYTSSFYQCT
ncbi:hypothetical protein BD410DRAFT_893286 [Rickenella mellea]|uniref:Uncharacterized protein n=1 Tax=Rickenella mellea TaxID=50990 RepID=A0A4R5XI33_9AGAM|nr:hypothetical protein BD410DRAFT_893286 [Rickenella mellea]